MSLEAARLYALLPAIHRIRDAAQGEPLRDLVALFAREWPYSLGMFGAVIAGIAVAMLVESVQRRGRAALRSR